MPIDPDLAAAIAARHGLSDADGAALVDLADNEDQAVTIAQRFAAADPTTYVRRLFAGSRRSSLTGQAKTPTPPDRKKGNRVPGEGSTPSSTDTGDPMPEFTRQIFRKDRR